MTVIKLPGKTRTYIHQRNIEYEYEYRIQNMLQIIFKIQYSGFFGFFLNEVQIKRKCDSQKRKKKASIKTEPEIVLLLTLTKLMKNMVLKSE